ncbi:Saccharopine dehydrogenase (NADP(+), L-lysine-forming) [Handroanthus impetiginosus]|uniref:Saccharopine dehydrogenase (NADP(+), L-lysine-forming) n=1 Tax=Handroanthus impetiginosus TaxID=429701 RepID=A0A2G9FXB7_9LAMI|nr:Saccharopine dehydrogenase (NADP(+), L-lysine-forming) [Handroanthus impetiginosus]
MLGNGVIGILAESKNKWERRVPLTPAHCARLLHGGRGKTGVSRIIVQPSTKRIHHDALYEDVGCEISEDLSECGCILGIKQPKLEMILPERAYAFFSHTHKAQKENMPLLDKLLAERATLFDYELIAGDNGKRLLAFGKFAGRAGMIDFLCGLGQRYLNLGYSTPFLSLGTSYMYSSLAAAKAAVISVGEEITTMGLPSGICPLVFVFTGEGNVSQGAQEIFKLLPHAFVDPSGLPELFEMARDLTQVKQTSKRVFQVYGCVVTCQDMVEPKDPSKFFDKADYYAHPENYRPVFHEKIAPFTSVIVNCMYWEKRYPRLLTTTQLQDLMRKGCPLVGVSDITCDIGGSIEFVNQSTSIDSPFFRYDPHGNSYHHDMEGNGVICLAVDILPTEFAREASQHFGDILSEFIGSLASSKSLDILPPHLRRACIVHSGALTSLFEYIPRMRNPDIEDSSQTLQSVQPARKKYTTLISLSGHLFDRFLINEALDIIEAAGGSFHFVKCQVSQSTDSKDNVASLKVGKFKDSNVEKENGIESEAAVVLILGAGHVCRPAAEFLTSIGRGSSKKWLNSYVTDDSKEKISVHLIVASLFLKDAEEISLNILTFHYSL